MTYQGGDPDGMRRLRRELQLAGVELASSRAAIERTMNEVCMATSVPVDLRRIDDWIDQTTARLDQAITALEDQRPPEPVPGTITGFPPGHEKDCGLMETGIGANVDELTRRFHELREDVNNLRVLRPRGPFSFEGHLTQVKAKRRNLEKQLETFDVNGCPGSLTVDVARQYVGVDIETELGWSAVAVAAAVATTPRHHGWWDVDLDIDLAPLGKVAAAAGIAAAAVAALARDAGTGGLALG